MKATQMEEGSIGIVSAIHLSKEEQKRLFYLGLCVGTQIQFLMRAPLHDPLLFFVRGNQLILRQKDAMQIEIEVVKE